MWQKAMKLVVEAYKITALFPRTELYSLTSQMNRTAISIPSNIAEGRMRGSRKEYRHFVVIARSSGAELETQIEIAKSLPFEKVIDFHTIDNLLIEVMKMLNTMISTLDVLTPDT